MKYITYSLHNFKNIHQISNLSDEEIFDIEVVGQVLPFKTNNYVVDELIDWDNYKEDPLYIMNFPQKEMLPEESFNKMAEAVRKGLDRVEIKKIANEIEKPRVIERNQEYEIDEMLTYIGKKSPSNYIYIIYAINKSTGKIIDFVVGRRTKENIRKVVDKVMQLSPNKIFTDGLNLYTSLISPNIHFTRKHCINRIERFNLTLRTHLKRLNWNTICYSKCGEMLEVCVKLYMLSRGRRTTFINMYR